MAEHTPGQWRLVVGDAGGFAIDAGDDTGVLIVAGRPAWASRADESLANGRLLTVAPDLLRVCISAGARLEYLLDLAARDDLNWEPGYVRDVLRVTRDELRAVTERATNTATETRA